MWKHESVLVVTSGVCISSVELPTLPWNNFPLQDLLHDSFITQKFALEYICRLIPQT